MPKRVLDGDALWMSDKLAAVEPESFRAEYANLIPLALANGSFECDTRRIWRQVYAYNRPSVTPELVEALLTEFERVKLLFRWQTADGKLWGFWVGMDKPGRLPAASYLKAKSEKIGVEVPVDDLNRFIEGPVGNMEVTCTYPVHDMYYGFGSGIGSGIGSGCRAADAAKTPDSSSLLRTDKDRLLHAQIDEDNHGGAGGKAPALNETKKQEVEQDVLSAKPNRITPASKKNEYPAPRRFGGQYPRTPSTRSNQTPPVKSKPISVPVEDKFEALDFVFENEEPFAGFSPTTLKRIVFYHWKIAKPYWCLSQANVNCRERLEQVLPKMAEQTPADFRVPGSATLALPHADPACPLCGGSGHTVGASDAYTGELSFHQANPCACTTTEAKPWRRWSKERDTAL